ncbi:hypothetical protein AB1L30_06640 [Bremerella sp. JC817]|uniref:hypothetical protein n=1 Tax=Bremerella sp. JC817 TaxID=3231756 RepID=UPI00345AB2A0
MAESNAASPTWHHDVPCPGCGCLCDDLSVGVAGNQVQSIEPACPMAAAYYRQPLTTTDNCQIDGQPASADDALKRAAEILNTANAPLFFGLGETTSEAVRRIVDLADRVGGIVDATHPTFFDPTGRILQTTGMVTCSLGEIRHRADLVIFWGCDPKTTHLRHWERYSVDATGRFIPNGRADRTLIAIGSPNATSAECDTQIPLDDAQQIAALHHLLSLATDKPTDAGRVESQLKDVAPALDNLHQQIQQAKYFVFVIGDRFLRREAGCVPLELLAQYVRPLHEQTRGAVSILRPGPNWVGAGGVIASRTGYPGGASLLQGLPQFDPDNLSAVKLLTQQRVDAAFVMEGPWLADLPAEAMQTLKQIPTVVLGHRPSEALPSSVFLPIARPGLTSGGSMSRMDDMPLPIRAIAEPECCSAEETVQAILERVNA